MKSVIGIGLGVVGLWIGTAATGFCDQVQATDDAPIESCRCATDGGPIVARIRAALNAPLKSTGLDFTNEPLENVVNFLQEEYQIPILIDEAALEDAGLTRDEGVSINLQNVSLRSALRLLLHTKQLTYFIREEVLIITTPEEAEANLVTCVYDVRDLVETKRPSPHKSATGWSDFDPLMESITRCIAFESWAEHGGGEAEIQSLPPGLLVISQTDAVHEEIANLLAAVRATLKSQTGPSTATGGGQDTAKTYGIRGDGFGRGSEFGMAPGEAERTAPAANGTDANSKDQQQPTPVDETPID